jgi:bifunctional DNase/RNase
MKRVQLCRILISETSEEQMIWLEEVDGDRVFPIVIGFFEAAAIDRNIKEIRSSRPLTHDLVRIAISRLGGDIERIEIHDIRGNTFYARIVIRQEGREQPIGIDARPSDAIAIALDADAPIYVADAVMAEVAAL